MFHLIVGVHAPSVSSICPSAPLTSTPFIGVGANCALTDKKSLPAGICNYPLTQWNALFPPGTAVSLTHETFEVVNFVEPFNGTLDMQSIGNPGRDKSSFTLASEPDNHLVTPSWPDRRCSTTAYYERVNGKSTCSEPETLSLKASVNACCSPVACFTLDGEKDSTVAIEVVSLRLAYYWMYLDRASLELRPRDTELGSLLLGARSEFSLRTAGNASGAVVPPVRSPVHNHRAARGRVAPAGLPGTYCVAFVWVAKWECVVRRGARF